MRTKTLWLWLALLVTSLALVAAGCGGDDDEAAGTGDTTEEQENGGDLAAEQVITVNWGTEPPSLDPGLATDTTSSNILTNIMDPLIKLDEDLNPVGSLAESWEESEDGLTYTLTLRDDGAWTNGDPVTAEDFEWAWKRTISPELAADYAYQFYGIAGAQEYNSCEENCDALREEVGVEAIDEQTLEVTLTSRQPWFLQQLAHHSFLAVHQETVEAHGENWTEPENIVTNGPFQLESWEHNSRIDLVKWAEWRDAESVTLERVNGRMISDATTSVQAFEAGEIDVTGEIPPEEMPRLKDTEEFSQYPGLGTYYYGVNVETVTDLKQRQAMALAINQRSIIDNISQAGELPANGFTPQGMPGFDTINPASEFLPEEGDIERAKALMEEVENPKRNINLLINDSPGHREIAVAVQDFWSELGLTVNIRQQEWAQFLEAVSPAGKNVDVYRLGWIGDYVDAFNFLELWTCDGGNNGSNYCNEEYDTLMDNVREGQYESDEERYEAYGEAEQILFGENGEMPIIPIYWYTYVYLEHPSVKDTFAINTLSQIDLTKVEVRDVG